MVEHVEYKRIAADITHKITSGELSAHQKLPSTSELADQYHVSVSTAYRALAILRDRGTVYGVAGKGIYVSEPGS